MKKIITMLGLMVMMTGTTAFAQDQTAVRGFSSLTSQADIDDISAAYMNPAGTAFLPKGHYMQTNVIYMNTKVGYTIKDPAQVVNPSSPGKAKYQAAINAVMPTSYYGYSDGKQTFFLYSVIQGGSPNSVNYDKALFPIGGGKYVEKKMEALSFAEDIGVGVARKLNDHLAVAVRADILYRKDVFKISGIGTSDKGEATGSGMAVEWAFGLDYHPNPNDNYSLMFCTPKTYTTKGSYYSTSGTATSLFANPQIDGMIAKGAQEHPTYDPWIIRAGASHIFPSKLKLSIASSAYLYGEIKDGPDNYRNQYGVAASLSYPIRPNLTAVLGAAHYTSNYKNNQFDMGGLGATESLVGCGLQWEMAKGKKMEMGVYMPKWRDGSNPDLKDINMESKTMMCLNYTQHY